ncbi:Toll-like receptor 13 [Papilio machaon]|uniref:Toll-like receptor 13 n=1 Tax=Papilio machaon TaxID=76193 RepID=A0A0N1IF49_PAPMA|nr:Toll-like receptor 13 [Papilio machaon]
MGILGKPDKTGESFVRRLRDLFREMFVGHYLWLLLCYARHSRSSLLDEYKDITQNVLSPSEDAGVALPVQLAVDKTSGCLCRTNNNLKIIVCFGNYECKRFPKVNMQSDLLRVITTVITEIRVGELDDLEHLQVLQIEANHRLKYLEPGLFRNLTNLKQLSISYNTRLNTLHKHTFEGLKNLRNLTLVNNGFTNILDLTPEFEPTILPALRSLDLSQNSLERIPETAFHVMRGTLLKRLEINLCRLEFIHPRSFEPLLMLKELIIGENDLNSSLIGNFLTKMIERDINLTHLDLSGMGFRKQPPKALLNIIANSTVERLILAENQFEIITDDTFPTMVNLEVLDLRKVLAISIGPNAFDPLKFPNLRVLLLGGNNLPGIHQKHISNQQLLLLDLSSNKGSSISPMYYEIDRDAFTYCKRLQVLNLAYNRIKSVFDYTFQGLEDLKILSMENGTLYHIGDKTFEPMRHLEMLNLANNPLTANENLTSVQFEGLNELKILILKNCGIKRLYDEDNIFEMMPNLTHLILRNNQLYYITAETLKPLKNLQVLDLSENLLISWWKSLFLAAGVRPINLYLTNNKISHFTISMIQDINYLLENPRQGRTTEIELLDNVFVCDCSSMFKTYMWLQVNSTALLRTYFASSRFQCSSPDVWEGRRVTEYLSSVKTLRCLMYEKISSVMLLIWTAPSLVTLLLFGLLLAAIYKYRIYIRYWMFLAKIAVGRKFIRKSLKAETLPSNGYRFDAFVSYCNDDREFVAEMINQLETTPPYLKLCVYERDFEIGSFISESILNSINQSKYIVLIVSNSFAKSQWCRWETQLAEYHRLFLEDGTPYDPLVLIRVGEVDNKYMTTTLKYLLKTKIYHSWDDSQPDRFWRKLRDTLARNI